MSNVVQFRRRSSGGGGGGGDGDPPPEPPRSTLVARLKASPVTVLISVLNVAYFLWIEKHGSSHSTDILVRFGAVESSLVRSDGEYWRMASYMLVHIGWGHLLMNTWAGGSWCLPVEQMLGRTRFILLYLIAGLGGGAAVVVFSNAVTAGASGAMFGIIGALLTIRYRQLPTWRMFVRDPGVRSTVAQIALWTVLGIVALPMSQAGHFGGLVAGALFTFVLTMRERRLLGQAAFGLACGAFLLFAARPWAKSALDWSTVKIDRSGMVSDPRRVLLQSGPACARGIERACVVKAVLEFQLADEDARQDSRRLFQNACAHGDADACAAIGILTGPVDPFRSTQLLRQACAAGSEWACEFTLGGVADTDLRTLLDLDGGPPAEPTPGSPDDGP